MAKIVEVFVGKAGAGGGGEVVIHSLIQGKGRLGCVCGWSPDLGKHVYREFDKHLVDEAAKEHSRRVAEPAPALTCKNSQCRVQTFNPRSDETALVERCPACYGQGEQSG